MYEDFQMLGEEEVKDPASDTETEDDEAFTPLEEDE